ncbi:hypothetical protein [Aquibium oceanicum]|nr:hypothetical protein [Aquibium oceanicum]
MENARRRVFMKSVFAATAIYWATYALVQVLVSARLIMYGAAPRFTSPLPGSFGVFAAFLVAALLVGRLVKGRDRSRWRSLPLPLLAGLLTVYAWTYLLVRTNVLEMKATLVWDEATTTALIISAAYLVFCALLLIGVRFGLSPRVR